MTALAFGRRMMPLALLAGAIAALVPPAGYALASYNELRVRAAIAAEHVATLVRDSAQSRPSLWRYDTLRIMSSTQALRLTIEAAAVRVQDTEGRLVFEDAEPGEREAPAFATFTARSAVVARGEIVAWADVSVDLRPALHRTLLLALVSALIGLGLFAALHFYPRSVVRALVADLESARQSLERRVAERTAELRTLSVRVVAGAEEERARVARELHDGVGQTLFAARLAVARGDLDAAAAGLDAAADEVRRTARDLRPAPLDDLGLVAAVRDSLCEPAGDAVVFDFDGLEEAPRAYPPDVELAAFRIAQEALTNALRHAGAGAVRVYLGLEREPLADVDAVVVSVEDDGAGIGTTPATPRRRGIGLAAMRERATACGGTLTIDSAPGRGTRVVARLPARPGTSLIEHSA